MEGEFLKEAIEIASGAKTPGVLALVAEGWFALTAMCETLGGAARRAGTVGIDQVEHRRYADLRISTGHAILGHKVCSANRPWPNVKPVYRVMRIHGMLLQHHAGAIDISRQNGRVSVEQWNLRWCSGGL